ncbi:MAG: NAD(P) transhydrogenase subunit alpha [Bacillota bacterium]|nr:NAD(P) transhydrogenase subunit alpha [Bacillota bacterium]MDI9414915.1 NAD(P) transhydrogenase subunit alpha [Bacillota bacterium]NLD12143.1 NAD(P) transhydrogenase subunit alpha [Bacillota bacterium]HCD41437.1 NAD(P)(+) transhydrogenase (Re/Si-specific) subunit alpha [Bacillota bacterium]HOB89626.1 NAD(P) transhydrogenase subunit alpha [Bacillota bacterium]
MRFRGLAIGIPKEIMEGERRVAAIPDTVKKMVSEGANVLVEEGAGLGSYFSDEDYKAAGARLVGSAEELFREADIILKVKEPLFNRNIGKHEVDLMKEGQCIVSFLHPAAPANHEMIKNLASKRVISFTLDSIPRISRAQSMDALTSMSTVAGYKGMIMAANTLPKFLPMMGTAVGMIRPAQVLVIGIGIAGLQAIATAKRLGAVAHATDIRPDACEQGKSLGAKIIDLGIPPEIAVGEGGYAKKLPDEWLRKEQEILRGVAPEMDVVFLSALVPGKRAPTLITEETVKSMKPGSTIVDVAIDQGGNGELTEPGKIVEKHGVNIIGILNIPGTIPTSSTWMFANNVYNYVAYLVEDGRIKLDATDEIIASSLVTRDGRVVHQGALEAMGSA